MAGQEGQNRALAGQDVAIVPMMSELSKEKKGTRFADSEVAGVINPIGVGGGLLAESGSSYKFG